MKHIGWCLDNIQKEMMLIPRDISSEKNKALAHKILDKVEAYSKTLSYLILDSNFQKDIHRLEESSIKEINLQAHEVKELLKDLEHMLYVLELYIEQLRENIEHNPSEWAKKADQLVAMIDQKFGGERGELRKEFQIAIHKKAELKKLLISEEHLEEMLKSKR